MILPPDDPSPRPPEPPPPPTVPAAAQAALCGAAWSLLAFALAATDERLSHRAAAAVGLSDGLAGRPANPANIAGTVERAAYSAAYRTGLTIHGPA